MSISPTTLSSRLQSLSTTVTDIITAASTQPDYHEVSTDLQKLPRGLSYIQSFQLQQLDERQFTAIDNIVTSWQEYLTVFWNQNRAALTSPGTSLCKRINWAVGCRKGGGVMTFRTKVREYDIAMLRLFALMEGKSQPSRDDGSSTSSFSMEKRPLGDVDSIYSVEDVDLRQGAVDFREGTDAEALLPSDGREPQRPGQYSQRRK